MNDLRSTSSSSSSEEESWSEPLDYSPSSSSENWESVSSQYVSSDMSPSSSSLSQSSESDSNEYISSTGISISSSIPSSSSSVEHYTSSNSSLESFSSYEPSSSSILISSLLESSSGDLSSSLPSSSSSSPSHSSDSYVSNSESFDPSSADSSSSSGEITFTQFLGEVKNPDAVDATENTVLSFSNTTPKTVAVIEKNGSYPISIVATSPSSVTISAATGQGLGPMGKAAENVSFTFKDSNGDVIDTASISLSVMKTLKFAAKQTADNTSFSPTLSADIKQAFQASGSLQGFTSLQAPLEIGLKASEAAEGSVFEASVKAKVNTALDSISFSDDISISYTVQGTLSYTSKNIGGFNWQLLGMWETTWSGSSLDTQVTTRSIEARFLNVDTPAKSVNLFFEHFFIRVKSVNTSGQSEGWNTLYEGGFKIDL